MGENEASALQAPGDAAWDVTGLTREQDVGVALSSIAHYAREHGLTGREVLDVFNAGIVMRHQAGEASECPSPRSDTESRPMRTLRYGFGEAGRRVFDPRQEAE